VIRVLIVDDREESRYLLHTLLKGNGYEVESACNGVEALDKARQNLPQLIVSDLLMPVMDGYTLLRQWRADTRLKPIPFVVYTATYTDPKDEALALSLGADAFILKPAEPADFVARLQQVLGNPAGRGAAASPLPAPGAAVRIPVAVPQEEETRFLRQYSEVLVHKLEDKMEQLEKVNRELQRDLAERRQIEEAHARLATAVEQVAEAIVITDTSGTIRYVNPAFEKITGYTWREAVGQNPRILKSGTYDSAFYRHMWDVLEQGKVWSGRIINQKKDGALYEEEMTISPIRDAAGEIINYVAVKHDVTQEVALETQLRQAQKMEAIGQLAGGVAHDFNNILTVIHGNAALQLAPGQDPVERGDCTQQIIQAAERGANLTRQLLLFSRKQVLQPANLDLNEVVAGMIKMLKRILGEDITLCSELAPALPFLYADAGMIEQVLLNLAVNSRDAMHAGGRLTIATGTQTLDEEQARQNPEAAAGRFVYLDVTDIGTGIPPEVLPRIFEPFFTTKEAGKGTGLGLATVHGIVKQHHGWVTVQSEVGKGTAFRIYLPAIKEGQAKKEKDTDLIRLPGGTETILLVEDETSVRLLMGNVLQRCGYTVLRAESGVAALKLWKECNQPVHLLLTDLVMPDGMSGFDLASRLQAEKPELKIVFTSGYSAGAGKGPPLIEGENFLQKPYSPQKLARVVRNCLDQKTSRA
jgi:two-component system, cell cycle sensor histidine kinase and response regulator CckA